MHEVLCLISLIIIIIVKKILVQILRLQTSNILPFQFWIREVQLFSEW